MAQYSPEQDQIFDHLDATGQFDAATIRAMIGVEVDSGSHEVTVTKIAPSAGDIAISGVTDSATYDAHDEWIDSLHLTHPSDIYPEIPRRTPEQRDHTTELADAVRRNIATGSNTPRR